MIKRNTLNQISKTTLTETYNFESLKFLFPYGVPKANWKYLDINPHLSEKEKIILKKGDFSSHE